MLIYAGMNLSLSLFWPFLICFHVFDIWMIVSVLSLVCVMLIHVNLFVLMW